MERGEKIAVIGANGIGKTTFLKSIQGLIPAISGTVEVGDYQFPGYFEQEMAPGNTTTCIEEIWKEFPSYTQYEVRSALAKCGLTTKNIESQVRVLSGGEQAKVRLCKLMNRRPTFCFSTSRRTIWMWMQRMSLREHFWSTKEQSSSSAMSRSSMTDWCRRFGISASGR